MSQHRWLGRRAERRDDRRREAANREAVRTGRGLIVLDVPPPVPSVRPADSVPDDYDG